MNTNILDNLSPAQREIVTTLDGVVTVNSSAGSGKTRSIVHRIAYMINSGIDPSSIVLTTFTKKSANEMKSRLSHLIDYSDLLQISIGTIHALCYRILKDEFERTNHHYGQALRDNRDLFLMDGKLRVFCDKIIQEMTKKKKRSYNDRVRQEIKVLNKVNISEIISLIALTKNSGVNHEQFANNINKNNPRERVYSEFYSMYEERKWRDRKLDMDDLLLMTYEMLKENEHLLSTCQDRWKYIVTDESQDQNHIQNEIIKMIAYPENNICLVGDVSQSIYGFRGSRPEEFINFSKGYENKTDLFLMKNYRSKPHIIHSANQLIENNTLKIDEEAVPHREDADECVEHEVFNDEHEQGEYVVDKINEVFMNNNIKYNDIAIIYRVNSQSRAIEDELIKGEIPYVIHSGVSFYERKEIKDILSYIRLAVNKSDNKSFQRVINTPSRYLGKAFMERVKLAKMDYWSALTIIDLKPFEKPKVGEFMSLVNQVERMIKDDSAIGDIIRHILYEGRYIEAIQKDVESSEDRLDNIESLMNLADGYNNVDEFLEYIDIITHSRKNSIDGVQLVSIHKSKGLEYDTVFAIGMNEGLLPHKHAVNSEVNGDISGIEEERRLAYVAMTRAENQLYMTSTLSYNNKPMSVSRFVEEAGIESNDSIIN